MFERDIYTIHSTYREDMHIKGFQFGKGEKSACIVGAARGNEIQQDVFWYPVSIIRT